MSLSRRAETRAAVTCSRPTLLATLRVFCTSPVDEPRRFARRTGFGIVAIGADGFLLGYGDDPYTLLLAHETVLNLICRPVLGKKN